MTQKQKKEIELPMEYNPGFHKYEPVLPMRKTRRKLKIEIDWKFIFLILIFIVLITGIGYLISKFLIK